MNDQLFEKIHNLCPGHRLVCFKMHLAVWDFLKTGHPAKGDHELEVALCTEVGHIVVSVGDHNEPYAPTQSGGYDPLAWFPVCHCHIRETMFSIEETIGELAWLLGPGMSHLPQENGGLRIPNYVMGMAICSNPPMRQAFERLVNDLLTEAEVNNLSIH